MTKSNNNETVAQQFARISKEIDIIVNLSEKYGISPQMCDYDLTWDDLNVEIWEVADAIMVSGDEDAVKWMTNWGADCYKQFVNGKWVAKGDEDEDEDEDYDMDE